MRLVGASEVIVIPYITVLSAIVRFGAVLLGAAALLAAAAVAARAAYLELRKFIVLFRCPLFSSPDTSFGAKGGCQNQLPDKH